MVPVLNLIGTDVACVGVGFGNLDNSETSQKTNACRLRTTIWILASNNSGALRRNAAFPGSSRTSLVRINPLRSLDGWY